MSVNGQEIPTIWEIEVAEWLMWYREHILHATPEAGLVQHAVYSTSNTGHEYDVSFVADGADHLLKLIDKTTGGTAVVRVHDTGTDRWAAPTVKDLVTVWKTLHPNSGATLSSLLP